MEFNESIANAISKLISTISSWALKYKNASLKGVALWLLPFAGIAVILLASYYTMGLLLDKREARKNLILAQNMDHRIETGPKLDSINEVVLNKLNADRVMTAEFHNSIKNNGGSDCIFFSERHERVNEERNIPYVTNNKKYDDRSTDDYPIICYLKHNTTFVGHLSQIYDIDKRYAHRMEEDSMIYCGMIYYHVAKWKPLMILSVSWRVGNEAYIAPVGKIKDILYYYGGQEAALLTFNVNDYGNTD